MVPVSFVCILWSRAFISSREIGSTFPFRGGRETEERNKKLSSLSCKHSCSAQQLETQQDSRRGGRDEGEAGLRRGGWETRVGIGEESSGVLGRRAPLVLSQSVGGSGWTEGGLPREERDEGLGPGLWRGSKEEDPDGRCQASKIDMPHSCGAWPEAKQEPHTQPWSFPGTDINKG